jgi:HEPN domain-containing protein
MNRIELQRLAQARLADAKALLDAGRWAGAYYIAGYAVECGLKSCILHYVEKTGRIFKEREYLKDLGKCWTHEPVQLVALAGLTAELGIATGRNPNLGGYWGVVKDWSETSRYEEKTEAEAKALYGAITQDPDGVLKWINTHW